MAASNYVQVVSQFQQPSNGTPNTVIQTSELWLKIDQLHLNFLKADESIKKLTIRKRLEDYIEQYLSVVPQDRKFCDPLTSQIILESSRWIPNFSALKAAQAFEALEKYCANLMNQPWRKEFKDIKMYGGFYKHNIDNALYKAERIFQKLGYRMAENDSLILDGTVDQDRAILVARDCVLAFVECTLIMRIFHGVSAQHPCTWEEVLKFRKDHIVNVEEAVRSLIYMKNQAQFQSVSVNKALGCQGQSPSHHLSDFQSVASTSSSVNKNRSPSHGVVSQPATGTLIDIVDSNADSSPSQIPITIKHLEEESRAKSSSPAKHGDTWDILCRQLGATELSKPDILALLNKVSSARQQQRVESPLTPAEEELIQKMTSSKINGQHGNVDEVDAIHRRFKGSSESLSHAHHLQTEKRKSLRHSRPLEPPIPQNNQSAPPPPAVQPTWECQACTFANSMPVDICDMCGKSRNSPNLRRSEDRGGTPSSIDTNSESITLVTCLRCTLDNDPKLKNCEACGATLERIRKKD